jgi:hypothetical protein
VTVDPAAMAEGAEPAEAVDSAEETMCSAA